VLYPIAHNPEPPTRTVQPWEMLFTYAEACHRLPAVLGAWLAHHDLLEPVFALYFGTLYNPNLYLEQRFIAYEQAIETYDLRKRPTAKERDPAAHKALIKEIVAAVPAEHRKC
jgi:ApeA N-terminal domain 1